MASYNAALNGGQTTAVLPLYADDGIFMAPYSPSAVGKEAVQKAYDRVFDELKFNVKFTVAELVVMAPEWAFVRTDSAGTTLHHSTGRRPPKPIRNSSSSSAAMTANSASPATASRR